MTNPVRYKRILRGDSVTQVSGSLLLDLYPNASAAYAFRKLRTLYSGSSFRVRRSSDNAEQDIGFLVSGEIDSSTLLAFTGAGNGFVVTWYDQSANGFNLTNSSTSAQPQIVASGSVVIKNSYPSMDFTNVKTLRGANVADWKFLNDGTNHSVYTVCQVGKISNPTVDYPIFGTSNGTSSNTGTHLGWTDSSGWNDRLRCTLVKSSGSLATSVIDNHTGDNVCTPNTLHLITLLNDPTNGVAANRSEISVDVGSTISNNTLTASPNNANPAFPLQLGGYGNTAGFVGYVSEFILYPVKQTTNNSAIKTDLITRYSL